MSRNWSDYQVAIFNAVEHQSNNLIIEAVAGSGKTTTIVEAMKRVQGDAIFLAFNKSIASELKSRGVNARTFHSLCFSAVLRNRNQRDVTADKLAQLVKQNFTAEDSYLYGYFARKLVGLAKQSGIGTDLADDTSQAWYEIVHHHNLELDNEDASLSQGVARARWLLGLSNISQMVDFDDMLYLAVKLGISLPKFDVVFVDEAQDTNEIQRAILRKIMHKSSRIVAVGDPAQAIYGFRGADSESLNLIAREFDCERLPLSVTYRCATSIVSYAQQWVAHIQPAPGAPAGAVTDLGQAWKPGDFGPTDLVVCRTTRPIVALAYEMMKARISVRIMGRDDISKGLTSLINKMKAKGIEALLEKLQGWQDRETEKAVAADNEGKIAAIADKVDTIRVLIDGLDETRRTVPALIETIDALFADQSNCTTLATIHKAKGLEANRVFWLNRSACPSKWAKRAWQKQQEANLCYVAATRAKRSLVLIEEKS